MSWTVLVVAGCATTTEMQIASVPVASRRLAALPSEGTAFDYDLRAGKTTNPGGTVTAKKNFDDAINYRLRQHGGRAFEMGAIAALPHASAFHLWIMSSLNEIRAERMGHAHESHESVGDWKFFNSLGAWRAVLDADFILVSLFTDGRPPPYLSPTSLMFFPVGASYEVVTRELLMDPPDAIACVVELQTSRIVWCNLTDLKEHLTMRGGAQADVDALLDEMLTAGDRAPLEPPPTGPLTARAAPVPDPGPVPPRRPAPGLHAP